MTSVSHKNLLSPLNKQMQTLYGLIPNLTLNKSKLTYRNKLNLQVSCHFIVSMLYVIIFQTINTVFLVQR